MVHTEDGIPVELMIVGIPGEDELAVILGLLQRRWPALLGLSGGPLEGLLGRNFIRLFLNPPGFSGAGVSVGGSEDEYDQAGYSAITYTEALGSLDGGYNDE